MFDYPPAEIEAAVARHGLLALELRRHRDCGVPHGAEELWPDLPHDPELTPDQLRDLILQAAELGARAVLLDGLDATDPDGPVLREFVAERKLELRVEAPGAAESGHRFDHAAWGVCRVCRRILTACVVTRCGSVLPTRDLPLAVGDVRAQKLADILKDSEVIDDIRHFALQVKGPCADCPEVTHCCGCRAAAHRVTGDYLASDPTCLRNRERLAEIPRLPVPAEDYLPQAKPMRVVAALRSIRERLALVEVDLAADSPFCGRDGRVDEAAYLEMMAQAIAALNGFRTRRRKEDPIRGYLLGCKHLVVHGAARVGERLLVKVHKFARYGDFSLIRGMVKRGTETLAEGEVKVWHDSSPPK